MPCSPRRPWAAHWNRSASPKPASKSGALGGTHHSISSPNALVSFVRTVRGYSPEPHSLNEPKSLYQSPTGATGSDRTHSCKRLRSARGILRSWTRSSRCSHKPRGRSEKRIFGNCVFPEDCTNQIPTGFPFSHRFVFLQETPVSGSQVLSGIGLGPNPALNHSHNSPAHRDVSPLGDAPNLSGERGGDGDALPDWLRSRSRGTLLKAGHNFILAKEHHSGAAHSTQPSAQPARGRRSPAPPYSYTPSRTAWQTYSWSSKLGASVNVRVKL